MSNNLAQYFQQAKNDPAANLYNKHSKAIDAQDDQHFASTTFQLKRTRSVGLLDEFIAPTKKLIEEDPEFKHEDDEDQDEDQFIENIATEPVKSKPTSVNKIYYDDTNNENDELDNNKHNVNSSNNNEHSHSATPELVPHDDNDIKYEPSRHVDYLSYNWKESDLSRSWKYIVLKRKDVANSARLENASWRTWAQAKYHLKTISPESVNWLKDSDVTWLYGPLYKDSNNNSLSRNYGSDVESNPNPTPLKIKKKIKIKGPKPILKKRTVTEILSQPLPHPVHNATSPPNIEDDFDLVSQKVNSQYNLRKAAEAKSPSPIIPQEPVKRHIHFNDRVEQCIAIHIPDTDEEDEDDYDENSYYNDESDEDADDESNDENDNDSDDEGGFFLMVKSPSNTQLHGSNLSSLHQLAQNNTENKIDESINDNSKPLPKVLQTIELLPSTTLKNCSDDEEEEKFALSHNTNTSRGYNYHYDYNSVFIGDGDNYVNVNGYEYEDTPQHLEGVSMVDVPEDIVLGSNVEIIDSPIINDELFINPVIRSNNNSNLSTPAQSPLQSPLIQPASQPSLPRNRSSSNFQFNNSDSESDSDEEIKFQPFNSSIVSNTSVKSPSYGISASSSYASLSDVAAQGYFAIAPNSSNNTNSVNQLEKDLKRSSLVDSTDNDDDEEEAAGQNKSKGFGFLNWNK